MKKKILSLLTMAMFIGAGMFAQTSTIKGTVHNLHVLSKVKSKVKTIENTNIHRCGTMEHLAWMEQKDPSLKARLENEETRIDKWIQDHPNYKQTMKTQATITIPVVVHVLYSTSAENISDAQVQSQIVATNLDYARHNSDTSKTPAVWKSLASAVGIQFCLAQIDPNGNPTTGILHVSTTTSSFSSNDGAKHSSSGGDDAWDVSKYFNIWVCNLGGGLLGYAEFPTATPDNTYGVVINYQAFGTIGSLYSTYNLGRTFTHESGHCFNLNHIWGDDNGACTGTDNCADTPNQGDATYGSPTFPVTTDPCSPGSPGIMFMNYMDYTDDGVMNMFTADQVARMQAAFTSSGYTSLATSNVCNTQAAPSADFTANVTTISPGSSVNFTDMSSNSPTSWSWTFTGGSPSSSTTQNPTNIVYNTAGQYTVTLTATNSYGSNTATKTAYINVTNGQVCDSITNYPATAYPAVYGSDGWGFVSGNNNYGDIGKADKFTTSSYQAGYQITGAWIWFGDAYTASNGTINVDVWDASGTGGAPGSTPIASKSVSISSIASDVSAGNKTHIVFNSPVNVSGDFYVGIDFSGLASTDSIAMVTDTNNQSAANVGWEMLSDNSWQAYSTASPQGWQTNICNAIWVNMCSSTTSMQQYDLESGVKLYPNPTTGIINAEINFNQASDLNITVYNMLGEVVKKASASNIQTGQLLVNLSTQPNGVYLVKISNNKTVITKRIVVNHF